MHAVETGGIAVLEIALRLIARGDWDTEGIQEQECLGGRTPRTHTSPLVLSYASEGLGDLGGECLE